MTQVQNRSNHTRFDPGFHFLLVPVLLVALAMSIIFVVHAVQRHFGLWASIWELLMTLALILTALKARLYGLKVQDRVIRLEERLRLSTVLPENLRGRIAELSEEQLIALRFASDAELAARVREALEQRLNRQQIKARIESWRADHWRV